MLSSADLLSRGLFPKELPPPFNSESLGAAVADPTKHPVAFSGKAARLARHNLARSGQLHRRLGIPNPVAQYSLCSVIEQHWTQIDAHLHKSSLSCSLPQVGVAPGRAVYSRSEDIPRLRAKHRALSRYLVKADISRFYYSIYTHSIPWAIHGKAFSKANKWLSNCGNDLDKFVRNTQDGQTMGVPVGPDTSLIIAELLLASIDEMLASSLPKLQGFRFWDDYELSFRSRSDAEQAVRVLQDVLADFELALNPEKTSVVELPDILETPWATALRQFRFRRGVKAQATDLIAYFDLATGMGNQFPGRSVFAYALGRLRSLQLAPSNWPLFQDLLLHVIRAEPATHPLVYSQFLRRHQAGWTVDGQKFRDAMNMQIVDHSSLGHGSEVAWALWSAIAFSLPLGAEAADAIVAMDDSIVALLGLDADERGLFSGNLRSALWLPFMTTAELYGEQWLLSYEANVKGWLPSASSTDHVAADPHFGFLKSQGVSFYDSNRVIPRVGSIIGYGGDIPEVDVVPAGPTDTLNSAAAEQGAVG